MSNRAVIMLIITCHFSSEPMTSLETASTSVGGGLAKSVFLPHNNETITCLKSLKKESESRNLQDLLNEEPTKMGRVCTQVRLASTINSRHEVIEGCANITVLLRTIVEFDVTDNDPKNVPFLHYMARTVALMVSGREYRQFELRYTCGSRMNYIVWNLLDRTMTSFLKTLTNETGIASALPDLHESQVANIPTSHLLAAYSTLDRGMDTVQNVITDAECMEVTSIWKNSKFARDNVWGNPKRPAYNNPGDHQYDPYNDREGGHTPKRGRTGSKEPNWIQGPINRTVPGPLALPQRHDYPRGERFLCAGALRNNSKGCGARETCTLNHDPMHKWSKVLVRFMDDFMRTQKGQSWNPNIATAEILGMKYSTNRGKV